MLSKHGQVAETFVGDRTAYKSPYPKDQTITETEPRGTAAKEMAALWSNVKSCLHETMETRRGLRHMAKATALDADIMAASAPVPKAVGVSFGEQRRHFAVVGCQLLFGGEFDPLGAIAFRQETPHTRYLPS